MKLQEMLVGEVLCKVAALSPLVLCLACSHRVQLEALEGVQDVLGILYRRIGEILFLLRNSDMKKS